MADDRVAGVLVKIERGPVGCDFYYIMVAAGQKLPPEVAERGTIVAAGRPEWFRLVRVREPGKE